MVKSLSIAVVCACMVSCAATTSEQEVAHSDFVPEGYELVWNDEFDSDAVFPDTARWTYETGGGGWGNNELQYYLPACSASDTVAFLRNQSCETGESDRRLPICLCPHEYYESLEIWLLRGKDETSGWYWNLACLLDAAAEIQSVAA